MNMIISEKENKKVSNSKDVFNILCGILNMEHETDQMKEHFWSVGLDSKNVIQYIELVSLGNLNSSVAHPREIFRFGIMKAVANIIVAHNHPSGNTLASKEDITLTDRLIECGNILGIAIYDHLIITKNEYFSFKDAQLI